MAGHATCLYQETVVPVELQDDSLSCTLHIEGSEPGTVLAIAFGSVELTRQEVMLVERPHLTAAYPSEVVLLHTDQVGTFKFSLTGEHFDSEGSYSADISNQNTK